MITPSLRRLLAGSGLAFVLAALTPYASLAAPIVITDQMDSSATYMRGDYSGYTSPNFSNRAAGGRHWGDELFSPGHRFDTSQITVERSTTAIVFTLRTMFNGNDLGARYADLFFDVGTPDSLDGFGYGIALGGQTLPVGVYSVAGRATSNDVWGGRSGYVYGGYSQLKTSAPGFTAGMAAENPVRITSGTKLDEFSVAISSLMAADGYTDLVVAVTASSTELFRAMDLFWATGDCGNDVIWGTAVTLADAGVPAPPGLPLLALGILALFALHRRRSA